LKTADAQTAVTGKLNIRRFSAATVASSVLLLILLGVGLKFFVFSAASGGDAPIDSIAVLPFQNSGGDSNNEFLGDDIAETLINNFTKIPELRDGARNGVSLSRARRRAANRRQGTRRENRSDRKNYRTGRPFKHSG